MVQPEPPERGSDARAVVVYNVARLALLVACLAVGWLSGLRGVVLLLAALLVSGLLSWFLLARQREAMAMAVDHRVRRRRAHRDEAR